MRGPTIAEVGYVYELAKDLMDEREKDYESSWKEEGITSAVGSLFRKASGTKTRFENGRWLECIEKTKEDILDEMNYCALLFHQVALKEAEVQKTFLERTQKGEEENAVSP